MNLKAAAKRLFLIDDGPAPAWCAKCGQTVKPANWSMQTYLCLPCEQDVCAALRAWSTARASMAAAQQRQMMIRAGNGADPVNLEAAAHTRATYALSWAAEFGLNPSR